MVIDNNGTIWIAWRSGKFSPNSTIQISNSNVTITFPNSTAAWTPNSNVTWTSFSADPANDTYNASYSADNGTTWTAFASNILPNNSVEFNGSRAWDSSNLADGNYKLRVCRVRANGFSQCNQTESNVTIDNPPAPVTSLAATVINSTAINWTWTNPANTDFNNTTAYVDGVFIGNISNTTAFHLNSTFASCTSHTLSLRTQDLAGNVNSTWTNLTASTQCPSSPPSGGGGGGGGCCGSAPVAAAPGEPVVFEMPPNAPIEKIEIVMDEPVQVKVSAKPLAGPPPGAPPPPGPVARFMEVKLTDPTGEPVKAKRVAMEFKVERTWMNQNGVPMERVALARLEGEKWAPYPAKVVGESPAEVKFKAEVPGTSVFAVTAALPQTPEPSPTPRVTPSPVLAPPTPTPAPDDGGRAAPVPTPRSPGFEVLLGVAALVTVAMARKRGK